MSLLDKYSRKRLLNLVIRRYLTEESHSIYRLRKFLEKLPFSNIGRNNLRELSDYLDVPECSLKPWVKELPPLEYFYSEFYINKKKNRGKRIINAPNEKLKILQKKIYQGLLKNSTLIHQSSTAYQKKKSILDNAKPHLKRDVVINIDLKDFFGHITSDKIYKFWSYVGWDVDSATVLRNICCYRGCLPQGAPTSPALSNICNHNMDLRMNSLVEKYNGTYTRYADDLTFSFGEFNKKNKFIIRSIYHIILSEGYKIQKKKRVRIQRHHQRQSTTGLVVNEKINLPIETRKKIRAMEHEYSLGVISKTDFNRLMGYKSLLNMINGCHGGEEKRMKNQKITILFISSDPTDQDPLELGREKREINESIQQARHRDLFSLKDSPATRIKDLQRSLIKNKPNIVHFSGHGSSASELILQADNGDSVPIPQKELGSLFGIMKEDIKCVVLNACYSEGQAKIISDHVPAVIGMNDSISDSAAIEYSSSFYQALAEGLTIEISHELAMNSIELHGLDEESKPQLLGKKTNIALVV